MEHTQTLNQGKDSNQTNENGVRKYGVFHVPAMIAGCAMLSNVFFVNNLTAAIIAGCLGAVIAIKTNKV